MLAARRAAQILAGCKLAHALAIAMVIIAVQQGRAETNSSPQLRRYLQAFLDRPPTDGEKTQLPYTAHDVIVARVRVVQRPVYLIGRDQSGQPPPSPGDLFHTRVRIVETFVGRAQASTQYDVFFGVPGVGRNYKYPKTAAQMGREYFIVSSVGEDGRRRLLEFPLDQDEFEKWEAETRE